MGRKKEWYETFFGGLYGEVLGGAAYEDRAPGEATLVRKLLRLRRGQQVLDVPCGLGRIAIPLAKAGLAVTGVDLVDSYVRRARRRAKAAGLDMRFLCRDMREIDFDGEFDVVVNWFTSFGYFSDADDLAFCRRVLAALQPGGRFLLETQNASWIAANIRPRSESTVGGVRIVQRHRWDGKARRMVSTWTFRTGRRVERHRISVRMYTGTEIRKVLQAAGFCDIRLFGHPPLGRFTRHSKRLIAVARRPAGKEKP